MQEIPSIKNLPRNRIQNIYTTSYIAAGCQSLGYKNHSTYTKAAVVAYPSCG